MLFAEIQEGEKPMRRKKYSDRYGTNSACTFRLAEATVHCGTKWGSQKDAKEDEKPESFMGDSWFTSVPVVEWMAERGHSYVGALKTSSALFPKTELEEKMKEYPSGAYLVMECVSPKGGHALVAIGYKYNKRKVLCFLATKSAGTTKAGTPYIAKFPDSMGNTCERAVPRPTVISEYFADSNKIDIHNQVRQGELKLEKRWKTKDCWFRLDTTLIGMIVTDAWKAFKHGVADKKVTDISIIQFADRLAFDCIHNSYSDDPTVAVGNLNLSAPEGPPILTVDVSDEDDARANLVSPVTVASTIEDLAESHKKIVNPEKMSDGRARRRVCRVDGCKKESQWLCGHPICRNRSYNPNGRSVKGMFYCNDHWPMAHWLEVQECQRLQQEY